MKIIVIHAQGNANVRNCALGFEEAGILMEFNTCIACFPGSILFKISSFSLFSEIRRRSFDSRLKPFLHQSPFFEICRIISLKVKLYPLIKSETGYFCVESVIKKLDKKVASKLKYAVNNNLNSIYAYEDGALFSFLEAKKSGIKCLYDLPTGYWRAKNKILEKARELLPEWQSTIPGLFDSDEKLSRKDDEIKMADCIFVASKFTAKTLMEYPGILPPVNIIPYGFPKTIKSRYYNFKDKNAPIKLLFVGSLSQQKGIANLFEAVNKLGSRVNLTLVGRKSIDSNRFLNNELSKHNWIESLPNHEILRIMSEHDILVFPTLFDGFGLVITEAMSQGTPVIATFNSAGPDLIEHGKNGWLVEAGSSNALQLLLEELIEIPEIIEKVGREALNTAQKRPWSIYRKELSDAVKKYST